jgi:hypothetical protein
MTTPTTGPDRLYDLLPDGRSHLPRDQARTGQA